MCAVTDAIDEHVVTTSAELPLERQQHPNGGRVPSASFASDSSMVTLSAGSMIQSAWCRTVSSGLHTTPDDSNFDLLS